MDTDTEVAALEARLAAASDSPGEARARIDALVALAWGIRFSQRERANRLATEARELAIGSGYALGQARAARLLAMTGASQGLRDVFAHAQEARTLFDQAGDRAGSAAARDFLASIFEFIGELSTAMELALEALHIAREIDDPVRQGYALSNVGGILAATGDVEGAFERLREALRLFETAEHDEGTQRICSRLATLCREQGLTEQAHGYARRMLAMAEHSSDATDRAAALSALAELAQDSGESEEAERLFRASLAAYAEEHARAVIGSATQVQLGKLLAERGALDEAEAELTQALDRILWVDVSPAQEAIARQALADVCERRGELDRAVTQLREVVRLKERAAQSETRDKLAQLEARTALKAAQQDAEIQRLKFVELSQMQIKLVEAERMAQLGALAAGTAHELNSPLGVLRSNLGVYNKAAQRLEALARAQGAPEAQLHKLTAALAPCEQTSKDAIIRIAGVAERFKRFTQLDLAEQRSFDLIEGLESAVALVRPNLPDGVTLRTAYGPVPSIAGWPGRLNQAFMTVLLNATQAIEGEGAVTVETESAGDHVVVRIRDSGRGMREEECAHLFDVGWAAAGARAKMRLGLAAAHATVVRHGGSLEVDSAPARGSTFTFRFPPAPATPATRD